MIKSLDYYVQTNSHGLTVRLKIWAVFSLSHGESENLKIARQFW